VVFPDGKHVISDCITSCDLKMVDEMPTCCADKGSQVRTLAEYRAQLLQMYDV
jgi:hypothetical protein